MHVFVDELLWLYPDDSDSSDTSLSENVSTTTETKGVHIPSVQQISCRFWPVDLDNIGRRKKETV